MGTNNLTNNYQTSANVLLSYNANTQTILYAINIISVTYTAAGLYTANYNALANTNFGVSLSISNDSGANGYNTLLILSSTTQPTTIAMKLENAFNSFFDANFTNLAIFAA